MLVIIIAYLIGSIPFGYLIVRVKGGGDVRETGSGGTGATNVTRRAGTVAGILTLILDAQKGFIAIVISELLLKNVDPVVAGWTVCGAAIAALVGHIFPIWLGLRGGKGVATAFGIFLALAPMAVLVAAVVFVLFVWWRRMVSLGSIGGAVAIPVYLWFVSSPTPLGVASVVAGWLIIFAHRENIARIFNGTESRITDLKR